MSETMAPEAETETSDTSVRASLEAAWNAAEAQQPTETPEQPTGRARDELGRFAREQAAKEEAEAASEAPEEPSETQEEAPAEEPATAAPAKAVEAPATWTAADKEMFGKQSPEAQAFLLRRMGEMDAHFTHQTQRIAAFRRDFEPVSEMFAPHRDVMREKGFTPASLVQGWIQAEGGLMNPQTNAQTAARIIKSYQIDPGAVMQALGWQPPGVAPQEGAEAPPPVPHVPPEWAQQLNEVARRVQTFEQQQAQERAWQMEQAQTRVMSEIERFRSETGPDGRPLRPYFAEVEQDMADIAEMRVKKGGDTPPLQELYDIAVRANPLTFARLQADMDAAREAQRQANEAKRVAEARARAAKAQRAGSPVTGAPRTGHAGPKNGAVSVMDTLREAYDAHHA